MRINLGIDVGNGNTKFGNQLFESKVESSMLLGDFGKKEVGVHEVAYKGRTYIVGKGKSFATKDRHTCKSYLLCLLTAVALSSDETDITANICFGVPTLMYVSNKVRVKEILEHYNAQDMKHHIITVDGVDKKITLMNVYLFAENALPLMQDDDENQILIDIGEGTVNISQWEEQVPVKIDTKENESSFLGLYSRIALNLKAITNADISTRFVMDNLGQETIGVNGKEYDFTFAMDMLEDHVRDLASYIKNNFDTVAAKKIRILGGGAAPTFGVWQKVFDNVELVENNQFINAEVYQEYVDMKMLQGRVE